MYWFVSVYLFTRLFEKRKWMQICRFAYRHNSICRGCYLRLFDGTISLDAFYIPLYTLFPYIHPFILHQSVDNSKNHNWQNIEIKFSGNKFANSKQNSYKLL